MKTKVYVAVKSPEEFEKEGFRKLPIEITADEVIYYKEVKVPKNCELVKNLIKTYEDPAWQKIAFNGKPFEEWVTTDLGMYLAGLGLNFERIHTEDGEEKYVILDSEEVLDTLSTWKLEVLFTDADKIIRMSPADFSFPNPLYPAKWIYTYAKGLINDLQSKGLIKHKLLEE